MKEDILVPSVGESVTRGILTAWLRKEGEAIEEGEDLFELETDKATVAVPAPVDGVLRIQVAEGQEVEIGQVVATLDSSSAPGESPAPAAAAGPAAKASPAASGAPGGAPAAREPGTRQPTLSPAVRRILKEKTLEPGEITGTGPKGRITKEDALKAAKPARPAEAPAARRPAAESQTRVPMTRLRQVLAERLVQARQQTALLTTFNEIDMTGVMDLRKGHGEAFEKAHGVKLGFMSFFVKACCRALKDFPAVNAMIDGEEIVYNNYYDIGVAVSTDRGLLVPVLREADSLSFAEVERTIQDLAARARDKKLGPDELTGGTFTITNGGVFGSLLSTPLPNYPQTAILGMHAIQRRPVAVEDQVVIRPMMYVALSYDHRLIDGRDAVRFLVAVRRLVEEPERLLLEV